MLSTRLYNYTDCFVGPRICSLSILLLIIIMFYKLNNMSADFISNSVTKQLVFSELILSLSNTVTLTIIIIII